MAVTFTNKAAREMEERLDGLVSASVKDLTLGTFHAICARILRKDGQPIGVEKNTSSKTTTTRSPAQTESSGPGPRDPSVRPLAPSRTYFQRQEPLLGPPTSPARLLRRGFPPRYERYFSF
jgi:superfamily I DNA/RNA helicase